MRTKLAPEAMRSALSGPRDAAIRHDMRSASASADVGTYAGQRVRALQ